MQEIIANFEKSLENIPENEIGEIVENEFLFMRSFLQSKNLFREYLEYRKGLSEFVDNLLSEV